MRTPLSAARQKLMELLRQTPAAHMREGYVWRLQDAVDIYVEAILEKGDSATRRSSHVGKTVELGSQCEAITHAGRRCSRDATVLFASKKKFCVQHSRAYEARSKDAPITAPGRPDSFASLLPAGRRIMPKGRFIIPIKPAAGTRKTRKRKQSTSKKKRAISYRKLKGRAKRSHNPRRPKDSLQRV